MDTSRCSHYSDSRRLEAAPNEHRLLNPLAGPRCQGELTARAFVSLFT
jgi:hypothetical protein